MVPLRLQSSSGGLIRVGEGDLQFLITAQPEWRMSPYLGSSTDIVTFPEVIKALKKGFRLFETHYH
jgi:hypothetical protein